MQVFNPPYSVEPYPFISGQLYPANPGSSSGASVAANRDYLLPFMVREAVRIDAVLHSRLTTTVGDIYTGIYDVDGMLLTDCAVDSVNTAGIHAVSCTPVTLSQGEVYYFCANSSAASILEYIQLDTLWHFQIGWPKIGTITGEGVGMYKARTAAALLSSLDLTGWTVSVSTAYGGFVVE